MIYIAGKENALVANVLSSMGEDGFALCDIDTFCEKHGHDKGNILLLAGIEKAASSSLNALWGVDSFVCVFGAFPASIAAFFGASCVQAGSAEGGAGDGAPCETIELPQNGCHVLDLRGARCELAALDGGRRSVVMSRSGAVFAFSCSLSAMGGQKQQEVLRTVLGVIDRAMTQRQDFLAERFKADYEGFGMISSVIPEEFTGPNARDYFYVLRRVQRILSVVRNYSFMKDFAGRDVFDVGCAFGSLSTVMYYLGQFESIVGFDYDSSLIDIARNIIVELQMKNASFDVSDMGSIDRDSEFDLVVSNNSINYLPSNDLYKTVFKNFYRALKKEGVLVVLTPSRMTPIEAFTRHPGVQFLPKQEANELRVDRKLSSIDYSIIKLPSPFEMCHWLREVGFSSAKVVDGYTLERCDAHGMFKPRFYVVAEKC